MNLWRYDELANRLKAGKVSELEKFYYFFVFMLVAYLGSISNFSSSFNGLQKINTLLSLVSLVIYTVGLSCLYKTNQKGDGKNFMERMICLAIPIGVRLVAFSVPVYSVAVIMGTYNASIPEYTKLALAFYFVFMVYYYYALYRGISIAAGHKPTAAKTKKGK